MGTFQRGRHARAFILICLTDGPSYGLELRKQLERLLPDSEMDMAFLYRTLNNLEKEGLLTVSLDDSHNGPVRKYYTLTRSGLNQLDAFEKDISERVANLNTFLDKYRAFKEQGGT